MSDESAEMAAAKVAAELAAAQVGGRGNGVIIIEPSPTNFDPNKMPKTVQSNVYTCARNQAYSNRVRIFTLLGQCDSKVKDLEEMEEERGEGESEDEYAEDIRKELSEDMAKIKVYMETHSEFYHNLGLSDTITPLLFSDPSFREIYENGFASLFITDLDRSVEACVVIIYWLLQHRRSDIGILLVRRSPRRSTLDLLQSYPACVNSVTHR